MPDKESPVHHLRLGRLVAGTLGLRSVVEEISPILQAAHSYERRDEAVKRVIPDFCPGCICRILLPGAHGANEQSLFSVVIQSPDGRTQWVSLTEEDYLGIVAACTFKQRARKMMEYYYADRLQYAVAGAPNRLEYNLGLFVKNGDGAADLKPIAHLYQSQVLQMAEYLGVPEEIQRRPPAINTYPLERSSEELYFILPPAKMDLCLYGKNNGLPAAALSAAIGLDTDQVQRVYDAIEEKRKAALYLRAAPVLVGEVSEV
jgi:NAD+ synthase